METMFNAMSQNVSKILSELQIKQDMAGSMSKIMRENRRQNTKRTDQTEKEADKPEEMEFLHPSSPLSAGKRREKQTFFPKSILKKGTIIKKEDSKDEEE